MRAHRWTIVAALSVLAVYGVCLSVLPTHVFWMPDEGAKYLELHSVHWTRPHYDVAFPAQRIDPRFEFLPDPEIFPPPVTAANGSLYLGFQTPVLFPLVSGVAWHWFGITGLYLLPLACGWGVAVVSGLLLARLRPSWAPVAVLVVGLTTPVWFYSLVFWEHTVACFLALLAVYIATASPRWNLAAVLGALVTLTAAVTLRMDIVPFSAAVFAGWALSSVVARRHSGPHRLPARPPPSSRWITYLLLAGLAVGLLLVFQHSLTLRHHNVVSSMPRRLGVALSGLWNRPRSLVEILVHAPTIEAPRVSDTIAVGVAIALLVCGLAAGARSARTEAALTLTGASVVLGFSLFLLCTSQHYRSLHGLFPVAPFVCLWPCALRHGWRQRSHALLTLAHISLFGLAFGFLAIAGSYVWQGRLQVGMEWGQRYMLALYPVLAVATLAGLLAGATTARPRWLGRLLSVVALALLLVGGALEIRGLRMLNETRQQLAKWDQAMRTEGPIITDIWWLPSAVAVLFTEHDMFFTGNRARVARWVDLATAQGVDRFTFASFAPVTLPELHTPRLRHVGTRSVDGLTLTSFEIDSGDSHP